MREVLAPRLFLLACALLFATVGHSQVYFFENFNTGIDTSAGNWTIVDGGNTTATWFGTVGGFTGQFLDGTEFAFVNSDAAGSGPIYLREELISPQVNTAGAPILFLEFDHYFRHVAGSDSGFVDVFDGNQWIGIDTFAATEGGFGAMAVHRTYDITGLANADLQVRFVYDDDTNWAWYWGVDNVQLSTPPPSNLSVFEITGPATNGRANTANAFTANQAISIALANLGLDTLSNIPLCYSINGGTIVAETLAGPIFPGDTLIYTFSQTSDLSPVGNYDIQVWGKVNGDLNPGDDSSFVSLIQWPNLPVTVPFCEDFEQAADTILIGDFVGIQGLENLDLITADQGAGRLRTGTGFSNSGNRAITLDKFPGGGLDILNEAILTYNLSAYSATATTVEMDLGIIEHGDEVDPGDSLWIRGCDTCAWIGVLGWNVLTGNSNGQYFFLTGFDVSNALLTNGQDFSATFQVRVGQSDNFEAASITGSDGMSFDDLCFNLILDTNAAVDAVINPQDFDCGDSAATVSVTVINNGGDSLVNIPVEAQLSGLASGTLNGLLPGPLAPGDIDTVQLNGTINTLAGGTLDLTVYTLLSGDQLLSDDTLVTSVVITPIPGAPQVGGDTIVCLGNSAQLTILNPAPNTSYIWYDSIGGTEVANGSSVLLGPITQPTTYAVNAGGIVQNTLGKVDNNGPGGQYGNFPDGLIFDAFRDLVIDSVDVYPNDTGDVVVLVRDAGTNLVGTTTVTVTPASPGQRITIPVGIAVPAGTDYTISADGSTTDMFRNNNGAIFPYLVQDVAIIDECINGLHTTGYYYFFYNWKVSSTSCFGDFTVVTVDTTAFSTTQGGFSQINNGLTVDFSEASVNATGWTWDFGDGGTASGANPTHVYPGPGTYQVCQIATGPCEADTFCDSVTVFCLALNMPFTSSVNGLTVDLMDQNPDASAWTWEFGDGNVDSIANPSHTYATDGEYLICLSVDDSCGQSFQICDSVTVCGPFSAAFNFNQNGSGFLGYDFFDVTGTAVSWHWDFGDGDTSNVQNPSHVYPAFGTYTVTFTAVNLCGDTSVAFQTILVVGVDEALDLALKVYPNPNPGSFRISLPDHPFQSAEMRLLDPRGKVVWESHKSELGGLDEAVKLKLSQGLYYLEVKVDQRHTFRKVLIQ